MRRAGCKLFVCRLWTQSRPSRCAHKTVRSSEPDPRWAVWVQGICYSTIEESPGEQAYSLASRKEMLVLLNGCRSDSACTTAGVGDIEGERSGVQADRPGWLRSSSAEISSSRGRLS